MLKNGKSKLSEVERKIEAGKLAVRKLRAELKAGIVRLKEQTKLKIADARKGLKAVRVERKKLKLSGGRKSKNGASKKAAVAAVRKQAAPVQKPVVQKAPVARVKKVG